MKNVRTQTPSTPVGQEPKSPISSIGALGSCVDDAPKTQRVVRNDDGVIVGATRRSEPKILGFIKLPTRSKAKPKTNAKAKRGGSKSGRSKRTPATDLGRASRQSEREATVRMANRRNAIRSNKQRRSRRARSSHTVAMRDESRVIKFDGAIAVDALAHAMSQTVTAVIRKGWSHGMPSLRSDQRLDVASARVLADAFDWTVNDVTFDEAALLAGTMDAPPLARAPIVTVMGHVDHGKTSLLDKIRDTRVALGEAGGITQHIGAYRVERPSGDIVFLDTPGHEAFATMRGRGAQVTDIVVLVVAADDGVMPTTVEAIAHARQAGVPIVVALNKMDTPGANPTRVKEALMAHGLIDEASGGDTAVCPLSAKTGQGINELLEAIALQAELLQLRAPHAGRAHGVVIEGRVRRGHGPTCTVLVQAGTLRPGDVVVVGHSWGKVRRLLDQAGTVINAAPPSTPVTIVGLDDAPRAGEQVVVVDSEATAKRIRDHRSVRARQAIAPSNVLSIEQFRRRHHDKALAVVLKADVGGSLEALEGVLEAVEVAGVELRIVDTGLGPITEGDVKTAAASGALVLGFNVKTDRRGLTAARRHQVDLETRSVIYELASEVKARMAAQLDPVFEESRTGQLQVRQLFGLSNGATVAGCRVIAGTVGRGARVRVVRDAVTIFEGSLDSLRIHRDDVSQVRQGHECGVVVQGFDSLAEGDQIEAFELREVMPELG